MVEAVEGKRDELLVVRKLPAGEKENDDDAARPPISAASACLLAVDFADGLLPLPFTVLSLDDNVVGMDDELVVVLAALLLLLLLGATDSFPPLNDVIDLLPSCEKKKRKRLKKTVVIPGTAMTNSLHMYQQIRLQLM